jgi:hypothetical protein
MLIDKVVATSYCVLSEKENRVTGKFKEVWS